MILREVMTQLRFLYLKKKKKQFVKNRQDKET